MSLVRRLHSQSSFPTQPQPPDPRWLTLAQRLKRAFGFGVCVCTLSSGTLCVIARALARRYRHFSLIATTPSSSTKSFTLPTTLAPHRHRRMGALHQRAQLDRQTAAHRHGTDRLRFKFTRAGQSPTEYRRSSNLLHTPMATESGRSLCQRISNSSDTFLSPIEQR